MTRPSVRNRHHANQTDDGLRGDGLPLRRMWRTTTRILSDIRAVVAGYTDSEQRHAECTAWPVPINRYDDLTTLGWIFKQSILRHYCGANRDTHHWIAQHITKSTNDRAAGVVNAIFVFVTFLLSLPALFLPTNRGWLRTQGWLVVVCAAFTLGLGIAIWVETLQIRHNLSVLWGRETPLIQSLLQQKVSRFRKR